MTLKRAEQFKSEIAIAEDGEAALAELEKQEFDIVLADYKMPRMNGIELLTLVRDKYPETLRILITGFSDINIAKEAINKAAVHNYIEKDLGNEKIRRTLYEALKRNMSFREMQELSPIEQLFESKDGRNLMYALLTFEDAENSVHTIVEKVEDGLPEIDVIKDKLRLLAKHNLIKQVKAPPLLFKCPVCSSYDYRLTLTCPFCSSQDLVKGDIIEHYKCSTVDFYNKFLKGENLVCPQCGEGLRQIGVDYRKVGNWLLCENCAEFFGEATVNLVCNDCKTIYNQNQAIWEKGYKIIPNKQRLSNLVTRLIILSEISVTLKKRGMHVARNVNVACEGDKKRFNLVLVRNEHEETDEPVFVADIDINLITGLKLCIIPLMIDFFRSIVKIVLVIILKLKELKKTKSENKPLPSISVIVPAHNEENKIEKSIKTLIEAGYPEVRKEIIVIDDRSTDNSYYRHP